MVTTYGKLLFPERMEVAVSGIEKLEIGYLKVIFVDPFVESNLVRNNQITD